MSGVNSYIVREAMSVWKIGNSSDTVKYSFNNVTGGVCGQIYILSLGFMDWRWNVCAWKHGKHPLQNNVKTSLCSPHPASTLPVCPSFDVFII